MSSLQTKMRRGFLWSMASNGTLRLGSLLVGIVMARLLAPEDFGVYAVALMVQSILMNFAELGLAADLVRHGDIRRRGPTITTIALVVSAVLTVIMWLAARPFAVAMGTPDAARVIQVLALTLPLAAITAVPYAVLQRGFQQSRLFAIEGTNFGVGTVLTIALAVAGLGPLALALGRLAGQTVATVLQFRVTGTRLRVGWRRDVAVSGIRFGFPLACAGLLAWTLLNVDTVVVATGAGVVALGFYVLAFNVSSWPSSVIGTAVRAVAFPAFAHRGRETGGRDVEGVLRSTALLWALSLPVALGLAVMAQPVVHILYGARWLPAAAVLTALALFGALRVVFDLWIAYLTACGAGGRLMGIQIAWILVLTPTMYAGVHWDGIRGAGWAHVAVAVLMVPVYLISLARYGVPSVPLLRALGPGVAAAVPAVALSWLVVRAVEVPLLQLLAGGFALVASYALLIWPWLRRRLPNRSTPTGSETDPGTDSGIDPDTAAEPQVARLGELGVT